MARQRSIQGFYYITHVNNILSILDQGILSHRLIEDNNIQHTPIYNSKIVFNRSQRMVRENQSLWDFANLYFKPRNAMLYLIVNKCPIDQIAILNISKRILQQQNVLISNGNAASSESKIKPLEEVEQHFNKISQQIDKDWWNQNDGSKREMMAECLVPNKVPQDYIETIYVGCDQARKNIENLLKQSTDARASKINIVVEPKMFFQPDWSQRLKSTKISLVRGDMFFSRMQTLTVSVNCMGVMGRGLASTAKYRFPDVYVKYQEVCRNKNLKIGQPYLYKRESSVFEALVEFSELTPEQLNGNHQTWFLLFPTKNHWKNNSKLSEIETGLKWLVKNYKRQGVESLAIPALGCGLGGLEWRYVGPLICRYLIKMDIETEIYLPAKNQLDDNLISSDFLFSQVEF